MSHRKRVIIDARMVDVFPHGIARYVIRLASGLSKSVKNISYDLQFLVAADYPSSQFEGFPVIKVQAPFLSRAELQEVPKVLRATGAALYHSPSFSSFLPWGFPCPHVQTMHDLNHLHFGSFEKKLYYRFLLKPFARRAQVVCTVSEFSRSELAAWLKLDKASIEVVYNALEAPLIPSGAATKSLLERHGLTSKGFFFCLSNPKSHKNIPFLLEAYAQYQKIAGESALPLVLSMNGFEGVPGVRCLGQLLDLDVEILRSSARAVVFPSLYEGFGLPPIEAALSGTPLIVSKITPHQEGLVDLKPQEVRWIDPRDLGTLVSALMDSAQGKLSTVSSESAQKLLGRFSEEKLACTMDLIYRRVLGMEGKGSGALAGESGERQRAESAPRIPRK